MNVLGSGSGRTAGRTRRRVPARAAVAVGSVAVAAALSGCGGAVQAGSAATVGNTAISQSALEKRTTQFLASLPPADRSTANGQLGQVQTAILNEMVLERLVGDVARQAGVTVSEAQLSQQVQQATTSTGNQLGAQLEQAYLTRDRLPDLLRVNLEVYAIGRVGAPAGTTDEQAAQRAISYITAPARGIRVRVNPRYGTWRGVSIVPGNGSLSSVGVGSASPTPAAGASGAPSQPTPSATASG